MSVLTFGLGAQRVPALLVTQGYAPALPVRGQYRSGRGLGLGRAAYQSARGLCAGLYRYRSRGGEDVAAAPVPPTPRVAYLRSREKNIPYQIDFARDLAAGDTIASAVLSVLAQPQEQEGTVPQADVTSSLLISQAVSGTEVSALLGNANAQIGMEYTVRIVATMHSGLVLQDTIGGGPESRIVCDM